MELQLGLALPTSPPVNDFDLNSHDSLPKEEARAASTDFCGLRDGMNMINKKRGFLEAFEQLRPPHTLPLLLWKNDQPEDDDDGGVDNTSSFLAKRYRLFFWFFSELSHAIRVDNFGIGDLIFSLCH